MAGRIRNEAKVLQVSSQKNNDYLQQKRPLHEKKSTMVTLESRQLLPDSTTNRGNVKKMVSKFLSNPRGLLERNAPDTVLGSYSSANMQSSVSAIKIIPASTKPHSQLQQFPSEDIQVPRSNESLTRANGQKVS